MFKNIITIGVVIISCCVLIHLGLWQLDRLEWKQGILADLAQQQSIDIEKTPLNINQPMRNFSRGFVVGEYMNLPPLSVGPRTYNGQSGYHLHQFFKTVQGNIIVINRGWIDKDTPITAPGGTIQIGGYLKSPDAKNNFTPPNNPEQNLWYRADIDELSTMINAPLYDKILYQESPKDMDKIMSFHGVPTPKNNHMQYALFWFFMAGLLPVLCLIFISRRRRA